MQRSAASPHTVDAEVIRRYDGRNTVFARGHRNRDAEGPRTPPLRVDIAEARAARVVHERFAGAYSGEPFHKPDSDASRHEFVSPEEAVSYTHLTLPTILLV